MWLLALGIGVSSKVVTHCIDLFCIGKPISNVQDSDAYSTQPCSSTNTCSYLQMTGMVFQEHHIKLIVSPIFFLINLHCPETTKVYNKTQQELVKKIVCICSKLLSLNGWEHTSFNIVQSLRLGYSPLSKCCRKTARWTFWEIEACAKCLVEKINSWSNLHNCPIVMCLWQHSEDRVP